MLNFSGPNGFIFYIVGDIDNDWFQCRAVMLGSPTDAKNYLCSMFVENPNGDKVLYSGKAIAIDDCINCKEKGSMLTMKSELIREFVDESFDMKMQVEIRSLKDEAKDEEIESGVSDVDD